VVLVHLFRRFPFLVLDGGISDKRLDLKVIFKPSPFTGRDRRTNKLFRFFREILKFFFKIRLDLRYDLVQVATGSYNSSLLFPGFAMQRLIKTAVGACRLILPPGTMR
jgi:hypothetical protein